MLGIALLAWTLAQTSQPAAAVDSLRVFSEPADSAALAAAVSRRPDDARDALANLLSRAASSRDTACAARLAEAARLARAYAQVWRDSFPLRQVAAFVTWTPEHRAAKVVVDSLRRAGVDASRRTGMAAAMRLWRLSLRRATLLADSSGQAAALGNLGAGFYYIEDAPDSARTYLERARSVALAAGDARTAANAIGTLAGVARDGGDLARARQLWSSALALRERIGDVGGIAADQNNLGLLAQSLGDLAEARRSFEAALAINRRYERPRNAATNLTNLANLAALGADFARASALYDEALEVYRQRGDRVDEAFVLRNAGQLEVRRGDYRRARSMLRQALAIYDATGPTTDAIGTRRDLALALAETGDLQGALGELRRAEERADRVHAPASLLAALAMSDADVAVQLNTLADADRAYARADRLARAANDEVGQAAAREGRGLLLLLRQDYDAALVALESAARVQAAAGDQRSAASTELLVGFAQQQRGDTATARRTLTHAIAALRRAGDAVGEAAALDALGDAEADDGQLAAAESLYRRGLARLGARPAPTVAWRLHAGLGEALASRGALDEAIRELHAAAADAERTSVGLRLEEQRSAFLEDKWSVYAQLALLERSRGDDSAAFAASERMRARQLLDLLARGRVAPPQVSDSTRQQEQDLRRRIGELTRAVLADRGSGTELRGVNLPAAPLDPMRDALDSAQRVYSGLLSRLRAESPEYARLVSGETVGWREAAARLAPDEALVEYLVSDSTSLAFVVTAGGIASVDLHVTRRTLATLVDFARANLARPDDAAARALWRAPLRRLHQQLIEPLEAGGYLRGIRSLILVPHGELHYLPFAALLAPAEGADREHFLVERYALTYTPSASLWVRLGERRTPSASGSVLVLAPETAALPATRGEAEAIQRIYGGRTTALLGAAASGRAFRAASPQAGIVHLATFGVLNKRNPLFSFVELAPADSDDGRLEVQDVFGLSLHARLVVLSACQTAVGSGTLGDVPAGDDWVGLVQAFLFAGAANVVGTLWPVEDRATARLMGRFYEALSAGRSEADALAEAQRASLREAATAHPFHWAGLALFAREQPCREGACQR